MDKNKKTIIVVGLGLIGGSLCLGLKSSYNILGDDANIETLTFAESNGFILRRADIADYKTAFAVFIAVPFEKTLDAINKVIPLVGDDTIITDTASVKGHLKNLHKNFVGGHPMAGTEQSGIKAAKNRLFENAFYVLTPYDITNPAAVETLKNILSVLNAKIVTLSPDVHDAQTAAFSHFPHVVAYSLVNNASDIVSPIAGSGFLDSTRTALSNPKFWTEVVLCNKEHVLKNLNSFIDILNQQKNSIENNDYNSLYSFFENAQTARKDFDYKKPYISNYCLDIDVADKAGEIARIAALLSSSGINLANIGVLNSREGAGGVLRIMLSDETSFSKAKKLLGL